jgi:NAD-dependent dihydropyrimidine dehydrogenase PreA subunit
VIQFKLARFTVSVGKKDLKEIDCHDCVELCPKKGLDINVAEPLGLVTIMLLQ